MPRKKKTQVQTDEQAGAALELPGEAVVEEAASEQPEAQPEAGNDNGEARTPPTTRWFDTVNLGTTNDGPKMRLGRSNGYQQMQMQFDEKPDAKYTDMLKAAGWRWRNQEKVWSIQLDKERKWSGHADAERLFREIANGIRADKGLEPVSELSR